MLVVSHRQWLGRLCFERSPFEPPSHPQRLQHQRTSSVRGTTRLSAVTLPLGRSHTPAVLIAQSSSVSHPFCPLQSREIDRSFTGQAPCRVSRSMDTRAPSSSFNKGRALRAQQCGMPQLQVVGHTVQQDPSQASSLEAASERLGTPSHHPRNGSSATSLSSCVASLPLFPQQGLGVSRPLAVTVEHQAHQPSQHPTQDVSKVASSTPHTSNGAGDLEVLPLDVRLMVYEELFLSLPATDDRAKYGSDNLQPLLACRRIYSEARRIAFRLTTFVVGHRDRFTRARRLSILDKEQTNAIRSVRHPRALPKGESHPGCGWVDETIIALGLNLTEIILPAPHYGEAKPDRGQVAYIALNYVRHIPTLKRIVLLHHPEYSYAWVLWFQFDIDELTEMFGFLELHIFTMGSESECQDRCGPGGPRIEEPCIDEPLTKALATLTSRLRIARNCAKGDGCVEKCWNGAVSIEFREDPAQERV